MLRLRFIMCLVFALHLLLPITRLLAMDFEKEKEKEGKISGLPFIDCQAEVTSDCPINQLNNENIFVEIFSYFNQKDIPLVAAVCKKWEKLLANNQLWRRYAEKSHIIMKEYIAKDQNYRELVKFHSTPFFINLGLIEGKLTISSDGLVVVGQHKSSDGFFNNVFRWTHKEGIQFLDLSVFPALTCPVAGVSSNGSVIVGTNKNKKAFRWTSEEGMQLLYEEEVSFFPSLDCIATSCSSDASVIIGSITTYFPESTRAFRWTSGEGICVVDNSQAVAISSNGSVIVGQYGMNTILWMPEDIKYLDSLNRESKSVAKAISSDGLVITGYTKDVIDAKSSQKRACRWTPENGIQSLGDLGENNVANAVSSNGLVIVGQYSSKTLRENNGAFRWTFEEGMQSLDHLGKYSVEATAVNYDGSVIVGKALDEDLQYRAFRWTPKNGMESMQKLLADQVNSNLILRDVSAVTPSGVVFVGSAQQEDNFFENYGWCAVIPRENLF